MNSKIEEARKAFDEKNYDEALEILDGEEFDDAYMKLVFVIKIGSLRNLDRYDDALRVIDAAIERYPYYDFFWSQKIACHYFNDEKDDATRSLAKLESIVDKDDKDALVRLSTLFELVGDDENALKYCDMALAIDENYVDAVRQKAMVASSLKDADMMSECADKLLKLYDDDAVKVMLPLILKLFSKRYRDCMDIVNSAGSLDGECVQMAKGAIYTVMSEDLNIEIRTSAPVGITVDEGLNLLFDYHYDGVVKGRIRGVPYMVSKTK